MSPGRTAPWRKTTQPLIPSRCEPTSPGEYDIYPAFPVTGRIKKGYEALASEVARCPRVIIDGYGGVFWSHLRERVDEELRRGGIEARWLCVEEALRPKEEIDRLVTPFLGGDDPLFGTRFTGQLADFFDFGKLSRLLPDPEAQVSIVYGCGAALAGWEGFLVYVDVPKNEIQFRSRAGTVHNLGADRPVDPKTMYKRFYFVDWVALNRHRADILSRIDLVVDEQRPEDPALLSGNDLRDGLERMSRNFFRVRPWFEPGPWGGQWIKSHVRQIPQDAPNYAWSFELISPENGLLFESDRALLEVSFDFLMCHDHRAVLGESAPRFGLEFPIRFDFLDTFEGGNLSLQCHPRPDYIRRNFGERFTQDETYYILDCKPGAQVYLGFQESVEPVKFREELERSRELGVAVDVERYVSRVPARKHGLYLIPNGTIHCSGVNNLVLEISATPYIFTFKMYDWLRLDLDGKPRSLNIARAFDNLYFERRGERVAEELLCRPYVTESGPDWRVLHLPTHAEHFYDVHRFDFERTFEGNTNGSCQVMNLVEGHSILLETANGLRQRFNYAETFVVPAAAGEFRLSNQGPSPAKVVSAFVKAD